MSVRSSTMARMATGIAGLLLALAVPTAAAAQPTTTATISDADRKTFASVTSYPVTDPYVRMLPRRNIRDQLWELTERTTGGWLVRSVGLGMCMAVDTASIGEGAPVRVEPCTGKTTQLWKIPRFTPDGTVTLTNVASGRCLTQPRPTSADTRLREFRCDGGLLQRFRINPPS